MLYITYSNRFSLWISFIRIHTLDLEARRVEIIEEKFWECNLTLQHSVSLYFYKNCQVNKKIITIFHIWIYFAALIKLVIMYLLVNYGICMHTFNLQAQDPRKRTLLFCQNHDSQSQSFRTVAENVICGTANDKYISKRFALDDMAGPFWANRGKKDPIFKNEPLFVEEPSWIVVRVREDPEFQEEPFFVSRGKKETGGLLSSQTRDFLQSDAPFFAARGKRFRNKH